METFYDIYKYNDNNIQSVKFLTFMTDGETQQ